MSSMLSLAPNVRCATNIRQLRNRFQRQHVRTTAEFLRFAFCNHSGRQTDADCSGESRLDKEEPLLQTHTALSQSAPSSPKTLQSQSHWYKNPAHRRSTLTERKGQEMPELKLERRQQRQQTEH